MRNFDKKSTLNEIRERFDNDVDRFSKEGIKVEHLPPIKSNELKCDTDTLTKLELTKCEMNARLMELKY